MPEYINHVHLTMDGSELLPRGAGMRWAPHLIQENAAPRDREQLINAAIAEVAAILDRAEAAFYSLLDVIGPGEHAMICTTNTADGVRVASFCVLADGVDLLSCEEAEAVGFCATIASGFVASSTGAVIVRTWGPDDAVSVRAWVVDAGTRWLRPWRAERVRRACRHSVPQVAPALTRT
ncbi:hypothetical protein [Streptomyces coerulescens]|uniref:Uncharacterized protein n=1 Tax=Streptomyces coerulescens TaxID=29304 RepID=A0ABW0CVV1_STRCD